MLGEATFSCALGRIQVVKIKTSLFFVREFRIFGVFHVVQQWKFVVVEQAIVESMQN